jgi:hypothetical protein
MVYKRMPKEAIAVYLKYDPILEHCEVPETPVIMTHPHLAPRLKKEQSYTSTPPLGLRGLF